MPTENRSSNTEMVTVPFDREERYVVIKVSKMHPHPTFRAKHLSALKREHEDALVDCVVVERDWPEYEQTWAAIEARVTGRPVPQPHPEPIAWMVGSAIWWTKEQAERDSKEVGEPVIALGPCADPGEVERLSAQFKDWQASHHRNYCKVANERDQLRDQLEQARRLLHTASMNLSRWLSGEDDPRKQIIAFLKASAEPSAPVECAICRDLGDQCQKCEEAEFVTWADKHFASADYRKTDAGVYIQDWMRHAFAAWQARGALAGKA